MLEHVQDLASLMGNCLRLRQEEGLFRIEVPYGHAASAWQDATHVRAMNEKSWIYECGVEQAAFMRLFLRKVATMRIDRHVVVSGPKRNT